MNNIINLQPNNIINHFTQLFKSCKTRPDFTKFLTLNQTQIKSLLKQVCKHKKGQIHIPLGTLRKIEATIAKLKFYNLETQRKIEEFRSSSSLSANNVIEGGSHQRRKRLPAGAYAGKSAVIKKLKWEEVS